MATFKKKGFFYSKFTLNVKTNQPSHRRVKLDSQMEKIRRDVLNLYEAQMISLKDTEIIWALIDKADEISRRVPAVKKAA
jgi:hypothetical protein